MLSHKALVSLASVIVISLLVGVGSYSYFQSPSPSDNAAGGTHYFQKVETTTSSAGPATWTVIYYNTQSGSDDGSSTSTSTTTMSSTTSSSWTSSSSTYSGVEPYVQCFGDDYGGEALSTAVAISGNLTVAGDPNYADGNYWEVGQVYVCNAITGQIVNIINNPTVEYETEFGSSVAISGDTVIVGECNNAGICGRVFAFDALTGNLLYTLADPNNENSTQFGYAVAMGGNVIAISAGPVVYTFDASTGTEIGQLNDPKEGLVSSLAISGSTVVAGAPSVTVEGNQFAGQVYVFNATTSKLIETLISPNSRTSGYFGISVAIMGSSIAVGTQEGLAYIFNGLTAVSLVRTLNAWGLSVAYAGGNVIVGDPSYSTLGDYDDGLVEVFNASTGNLVMTLISPSVQTSSCWYSTCFKANFGFAVAMDSRFLVVSEYPSYYADVAIFPISDL